MHLQVARHPKLPFSVFTDFLKDVGMSTCSCHPCLINLFVYFLTLPTSFLYTCLCHFLYVIINQRRGRLCIGDEVLAI